MALFTEQSVLRSEVALLCSRACASISLDISLPMDCVLAVQDVFETHTSWFVFTRGIGLSSHSGINAVLQETTSSLFDKVNIAKMEARRRKIFTYIVTQRS